MIGIGTLGFLAPAVLAGIVALPVLWWLLRAIPPAPKTELFAGVRLLLGLDDEEREAERTPLWLLLLRIVALAAVIIGFAQPVLNPSQRLAASGEGPVLILLDQGWASAPDWAARRAAALAAVDEAGRLGRQVILWRAATDTAAPPPPVAAALARTALEGLEPAPVRPDHAAVLTLLDDARATAPAETIWLSDGLSHADATEALGERLARFGPLRIVGPARPARALLPPRLVDQKLTVDVLRADDATGEGATARVVALVTAETGGERRIAVADAAFEPGADTATATYELPAELIGSISRLTLADDPSPGGTALADAAVRRIPVAVVDPASEGQVLKLTSARHYLTEALSPSADVSFSALGEAIERGPSAIFLADQGDFAETERTALTEWVEEGGLLVRFAGPRLAGAIASDSLTRGPSGEAAPGEDPLLPVRLRRGGRMLGGALAWGAPRTLGPFAEAGPFRRLAIPEEVDVRSQVLADPSPDLEGRVWARLDDGTPLVTAVRRGEGRVVLFHVSADAEWSSLPLSGLFVEMLDALLALAPGQGARQPEADELAGTLWRAEQTLAADGTLGPAPGALDTVAGERLASGRAEDGLLPGLYARADSGPRAAGAPESLVLNLHVGEDRLAPFPEAPPGAVLERLGGAESIHFAAPLLMLAVLLAAVDTIATLWLSGRLPRSLGARRPGAAATTAAALLAVLLAGDATAQDQDTEPRRNITAGEVSISAETTLGYVRTGNVQIDRVSERALLGLGNELTQRTAVEPGPPVGVDPENDELALLPVLYLPLTAQTVPSEVGLARLARYLAGGGMLLIDTQSGASGTGGASGAQLRAVARALNLPPLAPVDAEHVLSRTFYLLTSFPGRWRGGRVWAEAPPEGRQDVERDPSLPQFDRVDDNVSPVVVGSADWAAAWAMDERGRPMFPVGRPGDRQREMAIRFGVNLVLYALTGNYKSDQVHAPAVLERLSQ